VVDRVAERQVLLRVLQFSLAHIIAPTLNTHLHENSALGKRAKPEYPSKINAVLEIEEHRREKCFHGSFHPSKG
jgi:hypothetical protein